MIGNVLGFNEYLQKVHPNEFHSFWMEYKNYSNWCDPNFIKVGHIYKSQKPGSPKVHYEAVDGFKTIIKDNPYSDELVVDKMYHVVKYDIVDRKTKESLLPTEEWHLKEELYKSYFIEDVTGSEIDGKVVEPIEENIGLKSAYNYTVTKINKKSFEVVFTHFSHHSYIDWNSSRGKYNRHCCELCWKKYQFKLDSEGTWRKVNETTKNKFRLAADNRDGWCVDTKVCSSIDSTYEGCWKTAREVKKMWLGVENLAKFPSLDTFLKKMRVINKMIVEVKEAKFDPFKIKSVEL